MVSAFLKHGSLNERFGVFIYLIILEEKLFKFGLEVPKVGVHCWSPEYGFKCGFSLF